MGILLLYAITGVLALIALVLGIYEGRKLDKQED